MLMCLKMHNDIMKNVCRLKWMTFCEFYFKRTYPNLAVAGSIIANCILLRVTSKGYENDWAIAPANPPANSFAGIFKTRPPENQRILIKTIIKWK